MCASCRPPWHRCQQSSEHPPWCGGNHFHHACIHTRPPTHKKKDGRTRRPGVGNSREQESRSFLPKLLSLSLLSFLRFYISCQKEGETENRMRLPPHRDPPRSLRQRMGLYLPSCLAAVSSFPPFVCSPFPLAETKLLVFCFCTLWYGSHDGKRHGASSDIPKKK